MARRVASLMATVLVWGWTGLGAAAAEKTRLLVVHSYHREHLDEDKPVTTTTEAKL